ncbi:MAG: acyltransferase 3 [Labilithrix sp.]|nr:acyltransferase 3 [Labilithrix sp.]
MISEQPPATSSRARLWVAGAALLFYVVFILRTSFSIGGTRYFVLFEDAMISMRYARHVADGHGFVWNIGEPPIEGFTNLLWVLWMSVAHKLGMSESKISLFIMLTGIAIMVGIGVVTAKVARKITDAAWVPIAVLAAVMFDYPLVFWTLRGMEVGALALFVYTLLWLVLENEDHFSVPRTLAMGALTAGALLIRSDSVVPVGLICLYGFLFAPNARSRWLFTGVIAVFALSAVGGQTVFRRTYFHESLPNTYFLKLYKISPLARIKRGAFVALEVLTLHLALPISLVFACAGSLLGVKRDFYKDKTQRRLVLLGTLFVAQIGYATYVGGDAWEWMLYANRYLCIGMPALIVLVAVLLSRLIATLDAARGAVFVKRLSFALIACGGLLLALNLFAKKFPEEGVARTIVFSKIAFAVGGAFLFLGVLVRLRDLREGLVEGLLALRARMGSRATVTGAALLLMLLVWAPSQLLPLGRWAAQNAAQYKDEANYTRLGLLIRESTPPTLRMAVAAAGATPYFAQRPTEDLLGKNDRVIAHLAPRGVFSPGHDKWDYEYSLGQRHSDLIVETVDVNPTDEAYIDSLGFETLPNGMRLRRDAPVERRDLIGREMVDGQTLNDTLTEAHATLPPGLAGSDVAVVLAFGLVIALGFRSLVKDGEGWTALSPEPPPVDVEPSASAQLALKGAEARAIPTLDGMRGIAVLLVLMFHFAWTFPGEDPATAPGLVGWVAVKLHAFLWSGWTGVDLFFVLSGYLITRGLVTPSPKALGTRLKSFWMRRVLRIFPLYYAFIIVGTIVALALAGTAAWVPGPSYWVYMQNYSLAFDPVVLRWTAHFWSLAIEEQFYFVWPIVALVVARKRLVTVIPVLVVLVVLLRGFLIFKGASVPAIQHAFEGPEGIAKFVYRATFTRADGLLLGAFVAVTQREVMHPVSVVWRRLRFPIFVATALALAGLYVMANGLNDYDRRVMGAGYVTLALFFASSISMCADAVISERARAFLSWRPLVACGKVSYGMYIFHWVLVILLVPWLVRVQTNMDMATQLALTTAVIVGGIAIVYVLAELSFRFFETPFLKLKKRFHD